MRTRFAVGAVGLAAGAMLATAAIPPATAATAATAAVPEKTTTTAVSGGLRFGACPDDLAERFPTMQCGRLDVPLDYRHPEGRTISVFVSKVPARDPAKRRGSLFVNPGGPGGLGPELAGVLATPNAAGYTRMPGAVLDAYDLIGVDPRGNPRSEPVHCVAPDYFTAPMPDPDPVRNHPAQWRFWNGFSDGCAVTTPELLPFMNTISIARDFDRVRAAIGEQRISYYGISYGTWLGAVYGKLFPGRIDRMVLDGNVDPQPRRLWYEAAKTQAPAMQKRLESWYAWAAKYDSVFHLGSTAAQVRTAWNTTLASWRAAPHGPVGGNELLAMIFGVMSSESAWIPFAQVLSAYVVDGDDSQLVDFAAPFLDEDNEQFNAIFNAIICRDAPWPHTKATYERDTAAIAAGGNQLAWYNMFATGSACQNWPVPSLERPVLTGRGMPRILLLNSVGDPQTPYAGALRMHRSLPNSVLVTEKDAGKHGVFANSQLLANPQANAIGARYLVDGVLPAHDVTVPGHPYPVPTDTTAKAAPTDWSDRALR